LRTQESAASDGKIDRNMNRPACIAVAVAASLLLVSAPAVANASPASSSGMTPDLRAKLVKLVSASGLDREIPAALAGNLGLAAAGATWPDRQFTVRLDAASPLHAVAVGRGGADQDMVFSVRGPAAISVFHVGPDGTVKSAASFFLQTGAAMTLPLAEARSEFAAELAFWTANIDAVSAPN
jgi:hypothetical protein